MNGETRNPFGARLETSSKFNFFNGQAIFVNFLIVVHLIRNPSKRDFLCNDAGAGRRVRATTTGAGVIELVRGFF